MVAMRDEKMYAWLGMGGDAGGGVRGNWGWKEGSFGGVGRDLDGIGIMYDGFLRVWNL